MSQTAVIDKSIAVLCSTGIPAVIHERSRSERIRDAPSFLPTIAPPLSFAGRSAARGVTVGVAIAGVAVASIVAIVAIVAATRIVGLA